MLTDVETVPPCRVLVQGGKPVTGELWITERQRQVVDRRSTDDLIAPPDIDRPRVYRSTHGPVPKPLDMPAILQMRAEKKSIEHIARELGVCHQRVARAIRDHVKSTRIERVDTAHNKREDITTEWILARQAEGLTAMQMAERKGCSFYTIYARLRDYRRSNRQNAAEDNALRTCPCGARKRASRKWCRKCLRSGIPLIS